jgi:hypothetical protein
MNKDESPIHSTNVSLGAPGNTAGAQTRSTLQPWDILICSDLGFVAARPEPVTAATLNELIVSKNVTISGTVSEKLPPEIQPFHIEYTISDIKDLTPMSIAERLPYLQNLRVASLLLDDIARNRVPAADGFRRLSSMQLPQPIVRMLGTIIPADTASAARTPPATASRIDSILSMIDAPEITASPTAAAPTPPADFAAALTLASQTAFSPSAILTCKDSVDTLVLSLASAVVQQPFFRAAVASWNGLKTILKAIGRNRSINVFVHSAPYDAAQRHFADALGGCGSQSGAPDVAVWDYPALTDTATMQQLEQVAEIADHYKCVVVTSLDPNDDLYAKTLARHPLRPLLEQPAYIPLRRLQAEASSRCLAICAPEATVQRATDGQSIPIGGAWLLTLQWITSIIEAGAPFHLQNSSLLALDNFAFPKISSETVFEANRAGLTLLRPGSTTTPRVCLADADSPYGHLLFNLAVNRTARLAASWMGAQPASMPCSEAAPALEQLLRTELEPYNILSSDEALSVDTDGTNLQITVNSTSTVAGFAVKFQFSFNYRN